MQGVQSVPVQRLGAELTQGALRVGVALQSSAGIQCRARVAVRPVRAEVKEECIRIMFGGDQIYYDNETLIPN